MWADSQGTVGSGRVCRESWPGTDRSRASRLSWRMLRLRPLRARVLFHTETCPVFWIRMPLSPSPTTTLSARTAVSLISVMTPCPVLDVTSLPSTLMLSFEASNQRPGPTFDEITLWLTESPRPRVDFMPPGDRGGVEPLDVVPGDPQPGGHQAVGVVGVHAEHPVAGRGNRAKRDVARLHADALGGVVHDGDVLEHGAGGGAGHRQRPHHGHRGGVAADADASDHRPGRPHGDSRLAMCSLAAVAGGVGADVQPVGGWC